MHPTHKYPTTLMASPELTKLAFGRTGTLIVMFLVASILFSGCISSFPPPISPPATPLLSPTQTPLHTTTEVPAPTQTPAQTSSPFSISTPTLSYPPNVYPSPKPFLQPVNGITTSGCPDLAGLENATQLPAETALQLINALRSGDLDAFKKASDPTYWPAPSTMLTPREVVLLTELQVNPASQSPYDGLIRTGCGQRTLDLSWWVQVGTGALGEHYFMIHRVGHWLIWASYP